MNRPDHDNLTFFYGREVEHTPALGMKTLFVVGLHPAEQVLKLAKDFDVEHIYFGANQSFPRLDTNNAEQWNLWENMIYSALNENYWCTLDFDISCVEGLCESGLCDHYRFIPMISAKVPYLRLLGYNATLKLDDVDFNFSNPGVWCHRLHDLQSQSKFTNWGQYSKDMPL
jgi:hypothetical protein